MKSRYRIRMDFQQAKRDAQELDDVANQMSKLASNDLKDSISELSAAWTGDSSRQFIQKEDTVKERVLTAAKELSNVADDIRTVARRIYEAEMRAWEIAHRRHS